MTGKGSSSLNGEGVGSGKTTEVVASAPRPVQEKYSVYSSSGVN